jgi:hypothetical protein
LKKTVALEREPLSEPANDPFTLEEPPGFGNVKPNTPVRLEEAPYSENVMRLGRIVAGVQSTLIVNEFVVSTRLQAFEGLEIVVVAFPPVTLEAFDCVVRQPFAVNAAVVCSVLIPPVLSDGENASAPVMLEHVTLPVAMVAVAGPESELQLVADIAVNASAGIHASLNPLNFDMARTLRRLALNTAAFGRDGS